jgi:hypothetical protein
VPPDGYTTITISKETAEKLAQLMIERELETLSKAVKFAVDSSRPNDDLSDTELVHPLYQQMRSSEMHS